MFLRDCLWEQVSASKAAAKPEAKERRESEAGGNRATTFGAESPAMFESENGGEDGGLTVTSSDDQMLQFDMVRHDHLLLLNVSHNTEHLLHARLVTPTIDIELASMQQCCARNTIHWTVSDVCPAQQIAIRVTKHVPLRIALRDIVVRTQAIPTQVDVQGDL